MKGMLGTAFVLMLILKLAGVISWSWAIVLAPVCVVPAFVLVALGSLAGCGLWDRYMQWVPGIPLFWFDRPEWARPKLLVFTLSLLVIAITRPKVQ